MTSFAVSEEKNRWLRAKMEILGIQEKDIEEKFVRSAGRGGQKVNKTSNCVYLKHIPTGVEVKCMQERSQSLNRFLARRELLSRIERFSGQSSAQAKRIEKVRKQKSKRRRRASVKYGPDESVDGIEGYVFRRFVLGVQGLTRRIDSPV
jgi:protein subunit release factor B